MHWQAVPRYSHHGFEATYLQRPPQGYYYRYMMEQPDQAINMSSDHSPDMEHGSVVGLPDLAQADQHPMVFRGRHSSAMLEHWLTHESPVARASFSGPESSANPYRLPSLSLHTTIPDLPPQQHIQYLHDASQTMHERYSERSPPHHLHMSEIDNNVLQEHHNPGYWNDDALSTASPPQPWNFGYDYLQARYAAPPPSPFSSSSIYGSPSLSECYSPEPYPPVLGGRIPRSLPPDGCDLEEEEAPSNGKPYAQLIQECLLQAPNHRMMLRDIYDWFDRYTTKPDESGGSGWQNSIRHNLSMNKAFANDKTAVTNSRGEPKKSTSVWYLTDYALRHGVESTTRYRNKAQPRRNQVADRDRDWKRVTSGSKGGKAARKATHMRRMMKAERWPQQTKAEHHEPLHNLLRAANALEHYPCTRGSSPASPPEDYPCTPKDNTPSHQYPLGHAMGYECQANDLSFNELQLHDALNQAGYGQPPAESWPWDNGKEE